MKSDKPVPTTLNTYADLPAEARIQLEILDDSAFYIVVVLVSILLSYRTIKIQKELLLCSISGAPCDDIPDPAPLQFISSFLTLAAVTYFYDLARDTLRNQKEASAKAQLKNELSYVASFLVLISAIIRFINLNLPPETEAENAESDFPL